MITAITCIMCQATPDNPQPQACNPKHCPKLASPSAASRHRHPQAPPRRHKAATPNPINPIAILTTDDEPEDLALTTLPYRAVTNRAGHTIMAKPGTRRCDTRCQSALRPKCVCSCGGRNHSIR